MVKLGFQIAALCAVLAVVLAISVHQWSDCLEENSILTCFRMLSK